MFVKDRTDEEKAEAQKEWFETDMPAMLVLSRTGIEPVSRVTLTLKLVAVLTYVLTLRNILIDHLVQSSQEILILRARLILWMSTYY